MSAPVVLCLPVDPSDPCSRRIRPASLAATSPPAQKLFVPHRRQFLKLLGGTLILPALAKVDALSATEFVSDGIDPAKLWDGDRQLVFAYKAGEELGEDCQRLDDVKDDLPVSILWRLPPDWVKVFPTVHFEVSSRRWKKYDGWQDAEHFTEYYTKFNPPPKSLNEDSPFKQYAVEYNGAEWTYPGEIDDHLLDPTQPHRFSRYELQGLSKKEMENLHAAHHEERIEPGVRPPVANDALASS